MNENTVIRLYAQADRHQDAMVAWLVFRAAQEADFDGTDHLGIGRCPYSVRRIQRLAEQRDAWQEAHRFAPEAWEAASVEAARIVAEVVAEGSQEMTVAEVASVYGKSEQTVYTAIREGKLPARKSGGSLRIRQADAEARWGSEEIEIWLRSL